MLTPQVKTKCPGSFLLSSAVVKNFKISIISYLFYIFSHSIGLFSLHFLHLVLSLTVTIHLLPHIVWSNINCSGGVYILTTTERLPGSQFSINQFTDSIRNRLALKSIHSMIASVVISPYTGTPQEKQMLLKV